MEKHPLQPETTGWQKFSFVLSAILVPALIGLGNRGKEIERLQLENKALTEELYNDSIEAAEREFALKVNIIIDAFGDLVAEYDETDKVQEQFENLIAQSNTLRDLQAKVDSIVINKGENMDLYSKMHEKLRPEEFEKLPITNYVGKP